MRYKQTTSNLYNSREEREDSTSCSVHRAIEVKEEKPGESQRPVRLTAVPRAKSVNQGEATIMSVSLLADSRTAEESQSN